MVRGVVNALEELIERLSGQVRSGFTVDGYLAGGTATFMHLVRSRSDLATEARISEDADIEWDRRLVVQDDVIVGYRDDDNEERYLSLDRQYSIHIGLAHPDCFKDASELMVSANRRIRLHLLDPVDLAVTKVGRFQDHDREDIRLLAAAGLINPEAFEQRACEALDYLATDPTMVEINIDEARSLIDEARHQSDSI